MDDRLLDTVPPELARAVQVVALAPEPSPEALARAKGEPTAKATTSLFHQGADQDNRNGNPTMSGSSRSITFHSRGPTSSPGR